MRMWLCDPKIMCQKHLCGCHSEMHTFIGSMKLKRKVDGFLRNNCLEPLILKKIHDETAQEMRSRGYDHKSPLLKKDFLEAISYLDDEKLNHKIDKNESLNELINRCSICRERYELL